ncbi:MBL fold metallo-hydrolase [Croceibacterium sp. TMG7-5b_MA50]|uniref:MBL fold metallo-hydrolase n=1 Tax=Croceibacterium sp. TMG7-5b_MA50 TaxID=3121290 RepID=UPI0032218EF5
MDKSMKPTFLAMSLLLTAVLPNGVSGQAPTAEPSFITLGTMGGPVSDGHRSQPANVLLRGQRAYLIDAGDGAVQQLSKANIGLPTVKAVFISHLHVDHTGGLAAVLGLRNQTNVREVLTVYGPVGTQELVNGIVESMRPSAAAGYGIPGQPWAPPETTVRVVELHDGGDIQVDDMRVRAVKNTHYDFEPGSAEDQAFQSLSLRFDTPDRSITYTGDTGPSPAVERLAAGSDILVSEMIDLDATLANVARNSPNMPEVVKRGMVQHLSTHHLTPSEVGAMAGRANVKSVVVTHFAGGTSDAERLKTYQGEIGDLYQGPVTIANDLDRF